jgi:hypothetical protein
MCRLLPLVFLKQSQHLSRYDSAFQDSGLCRRCDTGAGCYLVDLWTDRVRRPGSISDVVVQVIL